MLVQPLTIFHDHFYATMSNAADRHKDRQHTLQELSLLRRDKFLVQ